MTHLVPNQSILREYGRFLDTIPDAVLVVNGQGDIIVANTQVHSLLGFSPTELVDQSVDILVPAAQRASHHRHVAGYVAAPRIRQLGEGMALRARHRKGHEIPVDIMLSPHSLGDELVTLCVIRDMRFREALEAQLRHSEERYRHLVELASEVFYAVDVPSPGDPLRGAVTYVSPRAQQLTGRPSDAFLRDPTCWANLVLPKDLPGILATTEEMLATGVPQTRRYRVRHQGTDTLRWIEDRIVPRYDPDGRMVGYQGVARDITEDWWHRRQLETTIALATRLRAASSEPELLASLLDGVLDLLEANGASWATREPTSTGTVARLGRGVLTDWTATGGPQLLSQTSPVIGTLTLWVTNSVHTCEALSALTLPPEVVALASVPLRVDNQTLGTLLVTKATSYSEAETTILQALGAMAAVALHRQRLHDEVILSATSLADTCERTIEGWAQALDLRDRITTGHTRRVTALTLALARQLGVPQDDLGDIRRGAMLHDIGKMGIPDAILQKPGPLTPQEQAVMRRHVEYAYTMLAPIDFLQPALAIPSYHHERWDGTGYPHGLKGEAIPLPARIFAVVDTYDAITSERPYAPAESHEAACQFIRGKSGSHFDPHVVDAFMTMTPPVGSG